MLACANAIVFVFHGDELSALSGSYRPSEPEAMLDWPLHIRVGHAD